MNRQGPSRGVKLVERLRLGERPAPVDWALAAAVMELEDTAVRFTDSVEDLVEDRQKASNKARFIVRTHLVAQVLRQLADATAALQQRLQRYFAFRTAEEDEKTDNEEAPTVEGAESEVATGESLPCSETGAALKAGGVIPEVAEAIGNAVEEVRLECAWLFGSVQTLLSGKPSDEEVLDFLSELEARFHEELFKVEIAGKKKYISSALEDAVGRS
ncbi:MAG: hypothetical protein C4319_03260 [Acidimicrobiia bacterium]